MYSGTMIENLIATVERAECLAAANPAQILPKRNIDPTAAYLPSSGEQLVRVA